jgi:hypothetical protein
VLRTVHVNAPRARVWARTWLNIQSSLDGFSSYMMGTCYKGPQATWDTYLFKQRVYTCERVCDLALAHLWTDSLQMWWDIQQIPRGYMSYVMCVWMHVLTERTSILSWICLARDGQWLVYLMIYSMHSDDDLLLLGITTTSISETPILCVCTFPRLACTYRLLTTKNGHVMSLLCVIVV